MTTIDLNHETISINPTDDLTLYDKNNIMSRIEKFLFAICSLDSSDLPVPLSRIEELYYCLVTGDTPPTFEPLSRAEKFLMACLGVYDVNKLPEPLSRSEVLLKKIATGDSNLEDVDNLQSKYEFLLAYIIQNGGIGDFDEYVLNTQFNTLYNTKEKPIKSAILKGCTLVNLKDSEKIINISKKYVIVKNFSKNQQYIAIFPYITNAKYAVYNLTTAKFIIYYNTSNKLIFTSPSSSDEVGLYVSFDDTSLELPSSALDIVCVEYQEGMENWDIPYFEGMKSVKMPVLTTVGKNLFDIDKLSGGTITTFNGKKVYKYVDNATNFRFKGSFKDNTQYTFSYKFYRNEGELKNTDICFEYSDGTEVNYNAKVNCLSTFTSEKGKTLIGIKGMFNYGNGVYIDLEETQLEESSTATEYEPFKSNILTCNEEVELRGIGKVKDELNLLTGELTECIGEIVFDGSETWGLEKVDTLTSRFFLKLDEYKSVTTDVAIPFMNDKIPFKVVYNIDDEGIFSQWAGFYLRIANEKLGTPSTASLQTYLAQNPITMHYQLLKPTIKTVVLTVVDQDGNDTKLSTFNDITHVTLSSEGLIPEAELEVAEKVPEIAASILTISREQEVIDSATNKQSENVDVTMIATTEIYEGLL